MYIFTFLYCNFVAVRFCSLVPAKWLDRKNISKVTYNVSSRTFHRTLSIYLSLSKKLCLNFHHMFCSTRNSWLDFDSDLNISQEFSSSSLSICNVWFSTPYPLGCEHIWFWRLCAPGPTPQIITPWHTGLTYISNFWHSGTPALSRLGLYGAEHSKWKHMMTLCFKGLRSPELAVVIPDFCSTHYLMFRYLQERIRQVEDERSHALSTIAKYKVLANDLFLLLSQCREFCNISHCHTISTPPGKSWKVRDLFF